MMLTYVWGEISGSCFRCALYHSTCATEVSCRRRAREAHSCALSPLSHRLGHAGWQDQGLHVKHDLPNIPPSGHPHPTGFVAHFPHPSRHSQRGNLLVSGNHLVPDLSPPFSQCAGSTPCICLFFHGHCGGTKCLVNPWYPTWHHHSHNALGAHVSLPLFSWALK